MNMILTHLNVEIHMRELISEKTVLYDTIIIMKHLKRYKK